MRKVTYDSKHFISQGFVQAKEGRFFPAAGTDIPMVRLLVDCRALNAACEDDPLHYYDSCPTQYDMTLCARIPLGSKFFKFYDLIGAFEFRIHSCAATEDTQDLLVLG